MKAHTVPIRAFCLGLVMAAPWPARSGGDFCNGSGATHHDSYDVLTLKLSAAAVDGAPLAVDELNNTEWAKQFSVRSRIDNAHAFAEVPDPDSTADYRWLYLEAAR